MSRLTPEGQRLINDIAGRYGKSTDAIESLLISVNNGHGTQAQFNHPELGGMGQWSMGGMIMIGDMFNNGLKATVDSLCNELSNALANNQMFAPMPAAQPMSSQSQSQGNGTSLFVSGSGYAEPWPAELGAPSSSGSQNNMRYAVFPQTRRLAIDIGRGIEVFDIGDHNISGFSQQQSGDQSVTFTSQYGLVRVADLPRVFLGGDMGQQAPQQTPQQAPMTNQPAPMEDNYAQPVMPDATSFSPAMDLPQSAPASEPPVGGGVDSGQIIALIQKLAELKQGGILSEVEFETKKAELLSRL